MKSLVNHYEAKKGVLLMNLGTPRSASPPDVKKYLSEFLDDPRVVDLPYIVRKILLYGLILPFRTPKTAKAYESIMNTHQEHEYQGSPLLYYSQAMTDGLQGALGERYAVRLGMRYGQPCWEAALDDLLAMGCDHITVLPLFAQYSSAVNGSALAVVCGYLQKKTVIPSFRVLSDFYDSPGWLNIQALKIKESYPAREAMAVIFSYHGLPMRQVKDSCHTYSKATCDENACPHIARENRYCYRAQCFEVSRQLAKRLGLLPEQYGVAFQSAVGWAQWTGPDLYSMMKKMRVEGKKSLVVACPSFVIDCLETLEEIGIRAKEEWHRLGGEDFYLVPCVNADPRWIQEVASWMA